MGFHTGLGMSVLVRNLEDRQAHGFKLWHRFPDSFPSRTMADEEKEELKRQTLWAASDGLPCRAFPHRRPSAFRFVRFRNQRYQRRVVLVMVVSTTTAPTIVPCAMSFLILVVLRGW